MQDWLPVSQRVTFKIAVTTYDCIHGRLPVYFRNICSPNISLPFCSRLRSTDNDDMTVPRTRTAHYGPRSFRVATPQIWNMLPPHLKNSSVSHEQFKSGLKTWLFVQAYSQETPLRTLFKRRFTKPDLTDWLIEDYNNMHRINYKFLLPSTSGKLNV